MARPTKEGLDYFPIDVDIWDDPKILIIEEEFGIKGVHATLRLLTWIYRNGYYIHWDNDMALIFAKRAGKEFTSSLVNDIVNRLVARGFFDKKLFNSLSILTSEGIQKRWSEIVRRAKRNVMIKPEYDLLVNKSQYQDVSSPKSVVSSEETTRKTEETPQSKVKKSKVKESKESIIENTRNKFIPPQIDEIINYGEVIGMSKKQSENFFYYYSAQNWYRGNGMPISKWQDLMHLWKQNDGKKRDSVATNNSYGSNTKRGFSATDIRSSIEKGGGNF